ncbi:hypothetical protein HDZ31DRAFT_70959 [Schizophyllum fasciatum]
MSSPAPTEPQAARRSPPARQHDLIYRGASVTSEYGADAYHCRPDANANADGHPDMPRAGQEDYDALRVRYEELAAVRRVPL